jgi:hypothetical protein
LTLFFIFHFLATDERAATARAARGVGSNEGWAARSAAQPE